MVSLLGTSSTDIGKPFQLIIITIFTLSGTRMVESMEDHNQEIQIYF